MRSKTKLRKDGEENNTYLKDEIFRIKNKYGVLKPELVVKESKSIDSKLHDYFDWNNSSAGEKYRLVQARALIKRVVEIKIISGKKKAIPVFYGVETKKKENIYIEIEEVLEKDFYWKQTFNKAIQILDGLQDILKLLRDKKVK